MPEITAPQRSTEWVNARAGIITASRLSDILTPARLEPAKGEKVIALAARYAAFRVFGVVPEEVTDEVMDYGTNMEDEAHAAYTLATGRPVKPVSLYVMDDLPFGASADGLVGDDAVYEGKCRGMKNIWLHAKYLVEKQPTPADALQMQGEMLAWGKPLAIFHAYHPEMPDFICEVRADTEVHEKIIAAIRSFEGEIQKLVDVFEAAKAGK